MTEMSFLLSLQAMHGTAFDSVMMAATDAGNSGKIWIALAALLIAFSRLWLFAHFPTDVIGGAVAGLLIGAATWFFLTRIPAFRRFLARSLGQRTLSHA